MMPDPTPTHARRFPPVGEGYSLVCQPHDKTGTNMNATVLWIIAVIIAVIGVIQLLQGQIILGIVLLVAAALVGPGGYSIFRSRA